VEWQENPSGIALSLFLLPMHSVAAFLRFARQELHTELPPHAFRSVANAAKHFSPCFFFFNPYLRPPSSQAFFNFLSTLIQSFFPLSSCSSFQSVCCCAHAFLQEQFELLLAAAVFTRPQPPPCTLLNVTLHHSTILIIYSGVYMATTLPGLLLTVPYSS
jgi:hypothetical protein